MNTKQYTISHDCVNGIKTKQALADARAWSTGGDPGYVKQSLVWS